MPQAQCVFHSVVIGPRELLTEFSPDDVMQILNCCSPFIEKLWVDAIPTTDPLRQMRDHSARIARQDPSAGAAGAQSQIAAVEGLLSLQVLERVPSQARVV